MSKLSLDVDSLSVQSFSTDAPHADRGTVQGHVAGAVVQGSGLWTDCGSCFCPDTSVDLRKLRRRAAA